MDSFKAPSPLIKNAKAEKRQTSDLDDLSKGENLDTNEEKKSTKKRS